MYWYSTRAGCAVLQASFWPTKWSLRCPGRWGLQGLRRRYPRILSKSIFPASWSAVCLLLLLFCPLSRKKKKYKTIRSGIMSTWGCNRSGGNVERYWLQIIFLHLKKWNTFKNKCKNLCLFLEHAQELQLFTTWKSACWRYTPPTPRKNLLLVKSTLGLAKAKPEMEHNW